MSRRAHRDTVRPLEARHVIRRKNDQVDHFFDLTIYLIDYILTDVAKFILNIKELLYFSKLM
jgi:hypothetical protein